MREYSSFEEINTELRTLDLKRKIALEELRSLQYDVKESLQPSAWVTTALKATRKYGILLLVRKIFR
ncbi:DUF6327 family protein [Sungkyunkwania multivorans]|uniref:DUF6327 family protein n=1 Tax=Sungkyunkwania multivorans TaxID=1173618 RepID=A0ABW3CV24_9FLAO